jgi:protein TonB
LNKNLYLVNTNYSKMKKIFLMMFLVVGMAELNAQKDTIIPDVDRSDNTQEDIFTVVEQMPAYPGGEKALNDFFAKNLKYPVLAKEQGIQGKVWMGFVVGKDGAISNVEVIRGIGGGCDEEAIRVVKLMPKWTPGYQSGRPVIVKFRFPINFTLR